MQDFRQPQAHIITYHSYEIQLKGRSISTNISSLTELMGIVAF
jgi:hypothetical protein